MGSEPYQSWGRFPSARQKAERFSWREDSLPVGETDERTLLPFGNGRSYGDSCLNDGGVLVDCRDLNRFMEFDATTGILRCEAGVLLADILDLTVPRGWFLAVTPGTRFITVAGAIANDVHGKNHHRSGTFGCHLRCFELLRSDGSRLLCSPNRNANWFRATVGGLGLTGFLTWAEIQLHPIANAGIEEEVIRYASLDEFFRLSEESDRGFDYTVAWIDCLARGSAIGRGLFMRGNHAGPIEGKTPGPPTTQLSFPIDPPLALINGLTLQLFNSLYYHKNLRPRQRRLTHYAPFFYPLDTITNWNRVYGSKGFLQYQCVIPPESAEAAIREILKRISAAATGSFLAVLKQFGSVPSPGLLSFPKPGTTLALDFPNRGRRTFELLDSLDEVTRAAGGRVYPAKDARMSAANFQAYYPQWHDLVPFIDPRFSSGFWRRVTAKTG